MFYGLKPRKSFYFCNQTQCAYMILKRISILNYKNLEIDFKDGMVEKYTCTNFEDETENKNYIRDNVLMHHETLPMGEFAIGTNTTAYRMARDYELWKNAILVALLNTMLFSYYSLAPFLFGQLGWSSRAFGWTGLLLAFASLSGSLLNQRLLTTGLTPEQLVRYACVLAALSGLVAWCLQHSASILIPVFGVVIAYGIAIPNVLSQALRHYREQAGAAGALFGLSYYLLLGMMLGLAGMVQQLGLVLSVCALLAWLCSLGRR